MNPGGKKCQGAECWGDIPLASVTFDTEQISLPKQIVLPLPVANQSGSTRKFTFNEVTMQIPVPIAEWLSEHYTYHHWLKAS
ncbi:MAG: hypothetical protein ABI690_13520 [Chloroflexota bacterium]